MERKDIENIVGKGFYIVQFTLSCSVQSYSKRRSDMNMPQIIDIVNNIHDKVDNSNMYKIYCGYRNHI